MKNCPFCGGKPSVSHQIKEMQPVGQSYIEGYAIAYIYCTRCGARSADAYVVSDCPSSSDVDVAVGKAISFWDIREEQL